MGERFQLLSILFVPHIQQNLAMTNGNQTILNSGLVTIVIFWYFALFTYLNQKQYKLAEP